MESRQQRGWCTYKHTLINENISLLRPSEDFCIGVITPNQNERFSISSFTYIYVSIPTNQSATFPLKRFRKLIFNWKKNEKRIYTANYFAVNKFQWNIIYLFSFSFILLFESPWNRFVVVEQMCLVHRLMEFTQLLEMSFCTSCSMPLHSFRMPNNFTKVMAKSQFNHLFCM